MSNTIKKISAVGLSLTVAVWLSGAALVLPVAQGATIEELQAQISALLVQIQALQAQLGSATGSSSVSVPSITRDLTLGVKGADVKELQEFLNAQGYTVASSGAGSAGSETEYFGSLTKAALAKFQAAKGISPPAGYFGPITRSYLSSMAVGTGTGTGTGVETGTVPSGNALAVAVASDSPSARTIGSGTAFNSALKVLLTAGSQSVNVTGITLQKSGFLANTNTNGVDIIDSSGVRHGQVVTSINADNTITILMSSDPVVIPAGQSETLLVRFNLLTGNLNGTMSLSINSASAITSNAGSVTGSFPISGSIMTVVDGGSSLASTTLDVLTGTGSSTLNVDSVSQQEMTKFRIQETSSNEGVYLHSLTLYNQGSGADGDVKDVQLVAQDGTVLATAQQSNKNIVFNLATPYLIDKGQTKDFTIKAKIVDGAARTINFVIYNNYDIDLRGVSTAVSVIPGAGSHDDAFPIGNGFNIQTIGSGSLTLTKASDSPSSAVTPGSTSVLLAKFTVKPIGENYELRQMKFYIATSTASGAVALSGTVYVKVNDAIVYSVGASSISVSAVTTVGLSSYPVLTAGQNSTITIVGDINSTATAVSTYKVTNFQITSAKRLVTNDLVTDPTATASGNTVSVKAAALAVTTMATPVANSIVIGTSQYEYTTVKLDASTGGEDVKVSKIVVTSALDGGTRAEVQNLYFYKNNETSPLVTTASTASNSATITFSFSSPILVARSAPVTLHLKADAVSGGNGHTFHVATDTATITAVGASTGNTLTNGSDISFAGGGQKQTHVSAGSLTLSLADGGPVLDQTMSAGSSQQTLFAFKLTSQYEQQKITTLKLYASSSDGRLSSTTIQNVNFYQDSESTPFASNVVPVCQDILVAPSGTWCTFTATASDNLLSAAVPFTGTTIYVKADIGAGGQSRLGDKFKFMIVSSTESVVVKGSVTGSTDGTRTGTPSITGWTYVVNGPVTLTAGTVSDTTVNTQASQVAGVFKITNNSGNTIRLSTSTTFTFNQTGSATSTFHLYIGNSVAGATTILDDGATSTQAGYVYFNISTSTAANRQITNGATKYLVIKNTDITATGSTWAFSVAALNQINYQVDESSLGYDSDPYAVPADLSGVAQDLYVGLSPSSGPACDTISISTSY